MSRIAIFGGSFNPPHLGHQALCLMLLEAAPVDAVWLIPTFRHYLGKTLIDFAHRAKLCRLLVAPLGPRAQVLEVEREMKSQGRMVETLREIRKRHPGDSFRLVIGADILQETDRWHRWEEVCQLAEPLVFKRHGYPGGELPAPPDISSSELRARLAAGQSLVPLVPIRIQQAIEDAGLYQ